MGGAGKILTVDEIVEINRRMIEAFGGTFLELDSNLANPASLEHVLIASQGSLFGQELHPRTVDKAAVICWRIIASHVFHDGNKRTGLETCRQILELNGLRMHIDRAAVDVALRIARNEMSVEQFTEWLEQQITPLDNEEQG